MNDPLSQAVKWYSHLASQPGWKEYVWRQVQDMAREYPALFADLPELLTAEMKTRAETK